MTPSALIDRASTAFCRWQARQGGAPTAASAAESEVQGSLIILRNVNGELARYRFDVSGRVRRVSVG